MSGVFGVATALITTNLKVRNKTKFVNNSELQKISRTILDETSATRFLIIEAKKIRERNESPMTIKILYEDYRQPMETIIEGFSNAHVDKEYYNIVLDLCNSPLQFIDIATDKMVEGFLKNYYIAEGIKHARLFLIKEYNNTILFGSISSTESESYAAKEYVLISLASMKITSLLNKSKWTFL